MKEREGKLNRDKIRRDLKRWGDSVQDQAKEVETLKKAAEETLAFARQERDR